MNDAAPSPIREQLIVAWKHFEAGERDRAEQLCRQMLTNHPGDGELHFLLGRISTHEQRPAEGEKHFQQALQARPSWPEAWNNLGNARALQANFTAAEAAYREALRQTPRYPEALNNLGNVLRESDRLVEAEQCYRNALKDRPRYAEAYNNLGLALRHLHRVDEAIQAFEAALAIQPSYPEAWNNLGILRATGGASDAAIVAFEQALRLRPDYLNALQNLGLAQLSSGRLEPAQRTLERVVSLSPNSADSHLQLGRAHQSRGQWREAAGEYERALRIAPDCAEACALAGQAHLVSNQAHLAIERLSSAIALRGEDFASRLWRGIAFEAESRHDDAEQDYQICWERDSACTEAGLRLGRMRIRRGDAQRGWQVLAAAVHADRVNDADDGSPRAPRTLGGDWVVRCDRSWSDAITVAPRYAGKIASAGGAMTIVAPPELSEILLWCPNVRRVISARDSDQSTDTCIDALALPFLAGLDQPKNGDRGRYLAVPTSCRDAWRHLQVEPAQLRIGIVCQQRWGTPDDVHSHIPLEYFQGLARLQGAVTYLVSSGEITAREHALVTELGIFASRSLSSGAGWSFADTIAMLSCMDLVITSDGPVAHCCAAAGLETWVLLEARGDWRWPDGSDDCSGDARVRLFRQSSPRRWHEVFEQVDAALRKKLRLSTEAAPSDACAAVHMQIGQRCYAERRFEEAESSFLHALRCRAEYPEALVELGNVYRQQQRESEAESCYRRAIELRPGYAEALNNLGISMASRREFAAAVRALEEAVSAKPSFGAAVGNLGKALLDEGRLDEAAGRLQEAIRLIPNAPHAHVNLADAHRRNGRNDDAAAAYRAALQVNPQQPSVHNSLGVVLRDLGDIPASVGCFQQALRLDAENPELHNNLGISLARLDEYGAAVDAYRRALALRPDFPDAYNNLGIALAKLARREEALQCYLQALRLRERYPEAHNNLGIVLTELGRHAEAIDHFEEALRLKAGYAAAHSNLGIALTEQGHLRLAEAQYSEALRLDANYADGHMNRALVRLVQGDMTEGWNEYEWRWRCNNARMPAFKRPLWNGEPLDGQRIVLHAEQGLGDTLQFVRYAPLVKARGAHVTVMCQAALIDLLKHTRGIDRLTPKIMDGDLPDCDYHAPLLGLPRIFETKLDSIPAQVPYLFADPALVDRWRNELADPTAFRVGINWQGNPRYRGDRQRSIPLIYFSALAKVPGVRLYSLQKNIGREQLADIAASFSVVDLGARLDEGSGAFMDTAAVVVNLDLVVTSDTAFAHLCGGLGVPTWLALPFAADWRWLQGVDESPWYPTMRLFRQPRFGDWGSVFDRLSESLRQLVDQNSHGRPVYVPVSPGELIDKVTILRIKLARIDNTDKRKNVAHELEELTRVLQRMVRDSSELDALTEELIRVNLRLWEIEDAIRDCERQGDFGPRFIELARSVYRENDCRAATKRAINELLGARMMEEKSYARY